MSKERLSTTSEVNSVIKRDSPALQQNGDGNYRNAIQSPNNSCDVSATESAKKFFSQAQKSVKSMFDLDVSMSSPVNSSNLTVKSAPPTGTATTDDDELESLRTGDSTPVNLPRQSPIAQPVRVVPTTRSEPFTPTSTRHTSVTTIKLVPEELSPVQLRSHPRQPVHSVTQSHTDSVYSSKQVTELMRQQVQRQVTQNSLTSRTGQSIARSSDNSQRVISPGQKNVKPISARHYESSSEQDEAPIRTTLDEDDYLFELRSQLNLTTQRKAKLTDEEMLRTYSTLERKLVNSLRKTDMKHIEVQNLREKVDTLEQRALMYESENDKLVSELRKIKWAGKYKIRNSEQVADDLRAELDESDEQKLSDLLMLRKVEDEYTRLAKEYEILKGALATSEQQLYEALTRVSDMTTQLINLDMDVQRLESENNFLRNRSTRSPMFDSRYSTNYSPTRPITPMNQRSSRTAASVLTQEQMSTMSRSFSDTMQSDRPIRNQATAKTADTSPIGLNRLSSERTKQSNPTITDDAGDRKIDLSDISASDRPRSNSKVTRHSVKVVNTKGIRSMDSVGNLPSNDLPSAEEDGTLELSAAKERMSHISRLDAGLYASPAGVQLRNAQPHSAPPTKSGMHVLMDENGQERVRSRTEEYRRISRLPTNMEADGSSWSRRKSPGRRIPISPTAPSSRIQFEPYASRSLPRIRPGSFFDLARSPIRSELYSPALPPRPTTSLGRVANLDASLSPPIHRRRPTTPGYHRPVPSSWIEKEIKLSYPDLAQRESEVRKLEKQYNDLLLRKLKREKMLARKDYYAQAQRLQYDDERYLDPHLMDIEHQLERTRKSLAKRYLHH